MNVKRKEGGREKEKETGERREERVERHSQHMLFGKGPLTIKINRGKHRDVVTKGILCCSSFLPTARIFAGLSGFEDGLV